MFMKILFIALILFNLILNLLKASYDRKLDVLKDSDAIATKKEVHQIHKLMKNSQSMDNNVFIVTSSAVIIIFKVQGNMRITMMVLLVATFFISQVIDTVIKRRDVLRNIKKLEQSIEERQSEQNHL